MKANKTSHSYWLLTGAISLLSAAAFAAAPVVKTVPWVASNPLIPHSTYSGKTITLKGTCDQQGANLQWTWDFGDGSPVATGTVTDRYAIQATHVYGGPVGTIYTARLTVLNTSTGEFNSKTYFVQMMDKTLDVEVNIAIDEGLWYLHKSQARSTSGGVDYGDWRTGLYGGAAASWWTSVSVANLNAFEVNGHLETGNTDNPYTETVQRAMRSLLTWLTTRPIGLQVKGNPDANANGYGVYVWQGYSYYQGGMFMDAIVASGTPTAIATTGQAPSGGNPGILGRTYASIVQDMADDHAWAQYDYYPPGGGWRYNPNEWPDNSACQWAAIGLIAAERNWGLTVPQWVKDWNVPWLFYTQAGDGRFGYTSTGDVWGPYATTPSGMVQMVLDGIGRDMTGPSWPSWNKSETFIRNNFGNAGGPGNAIKDYYYGLFSFVKSMLLHRMDTDADGDLDPAPITMLRSQTVGVLPIDWYAAEVSKGDPTDGVARTLVGDQSASGYWYGHNISGDQYPFETAWAIMMLHRTLFESGVPVAVAKAIPNPCVVGQHVTLDGSDSYHQSPQRIVDSWEWDLDNNGSIDASGPTITVTYSGVGNYLARLRVTDDGDPEKSAETILTVNVTTPPVAPTADADGPYVFCTAWQPWFLDGRNSVNPDEGQHEPGPYPGDTIQSYEWDLDGDGQFDDAVGPTPDVTAFFSSLGAGSYLVQLRVTDTTGTSYPSSGFGDLSDVTTAQVFVVPTASDLCKCVELTVTPLLKQVQLSWTAYPGAASYNVYRGTISGGPYLKVANVAGTSYTDSPGALNHVYYYVVRPAALNGDEFCQSNEASAEPLHPPPTASVTLTNMSNLNRYYYYISATSECFGSMQLQLWVRDTGSSMVVGPLPNKSIVYIREGMIAPSSRNGNATVVKLILCKGQAELYAVDPIGQSSPVVPVP